MICGLLERSDTVHHRRNDISTDNLRVSSLTIGGRKYSIGLTLTTVGADCFLTRWRKKNTTHKTTQILWDLAYMKSYF